MAFPRLRLLFIDPDPIFRMGLRIAFEPFADLEVVADVATGEEGLQVLLSKVEEGINPQAAKPVDLIVLEIEGLTGINLSDLSPEFSPAIAFCQHLKTLYPLVPILLLTTIKQPALLTAAQQVGVEGYCAKGINIEDLVPILKRVAAGERNGLDAISRFNQEFLATTSTAKPATFFNKMRVFFVQPGLRQIEQAIAEVNTELQQNIEQFDPGDTIAVLNRLILTGRRRELIAARWIASQFLPSSRPQLVDDNPSNFVNPSPPLNSVDSAKSHSDSPGSLVVTADAALSSQSATLFTDWQAILLDNTVTKLQSGLINNTGIPLEIDILKLSKKRELMYLILKQLEILLEELKLSNLQPEQLREKSLTLVQDLWEAATLDFFGKYYTLSWNQQDIEVIPILLNDAEIVKRDILNKIPLLNELFSHLLFKTPLLIDNSLYSPGSFEAVQRAETLLQNLLISMANSVIQPLLNHFSDFEAVKQKFYDRRLLSTREIEKFRNNLSWRYRLLKYVAEPKAIFESCYLLFFLGERGVQKQIIYSSRREELEQLSGVPLAVTLILETRDAIAPRVRAAVSFLGSGVVYLLTQVIGRGIGLIGKGILQGIGTSLQDNRSGKK